MTRILCKLLFAVLIAARVEAAPITVSAGESVLFNFDLTAAVPPPPYAQLLFVTGLAGDSLMDPEVEAGTWTLFSGLNATGTAFSTSTYSLFSSAPSESDGVFSARLTMTQGSIVVDPYAHGIVDRVLTQPLFGTLVTPAPEPATLALLGMGLVAMGGRAYRRRKAER